MRFAHVPANLWFGTEDSYWAYCSAIDEVRTLEAAGPEALKAAIQLRGGGFGGDPFGVPPMWSMQGDTAVVNIRGSLVNGSSGFMRLFGVVGYEDIKGAISEALSQKEPPKRLLFDIDSGGGAVNGVTDAGDFIRQTGERLPTASYTGGTMGSAAIWLGASADKIFASSTAQVGSVGTLIVHTDYSKMLADEGIKKTPIAYGKFKAVGNPFEPLSEDGQKQLQGMADESGKIFVEYMAERRGTTPEEFQKTMGEGRVLMGRQALKAGLIDGVMSFEETLASMKTLDKPNSTVENSRQSAKDPKMKIRAISQAVILALASGTKIEALGLAEPTANVEGVKPEAADVLALQADATAVQAAFADATTKAVDAAVASVKAASDQVVATLTGERDQLASKVTLLEAGATDLTGKVTAANELTANYSSVVKASIAVMATALGVADTAAALTGKDLMAEHDRLKEVFAKKFPMGGVAAVNIPVKQVDAGTAPPAAFAALAQANVARQAARK